MQPRPARAVARLTRNSLKSTMSAIRFLLPSVFVFSLVGCVTTAPDPREATHLAVLASGAAVHEKARACQELASVGGPASVPAFAALLGQEHLADYARSGLENIKDPSAGAALRQALPKLEGRYLAGAVNSLGVRRDVAAIPDLERLALDPKRGAATAAVASLGLIGTADAAKALERLLATGPADLRVPAAHAALAAAELLAKEGNPAAARSVLGSVVRALPPGFLATVAQRQVAVLK